MASILGYFNPRHAGDTFAGLNSSIEGNVGTTIERSLPAFLSAAGRDYPILRVPAYALDPQGGVGPNGDIIQAFRQVENQYHLVRGSDHRIVSHSTVTQSMGILSLVDVAAHLEPMVAEGWMTPDGVYGTEDGSLEVLSLRLDAGDSSILDEKEWRHYAVVQLPHGRGKAEGKIISWRIVCCNTFAAAVSSTADFAITHRIGRTMDPAETMNERAALAVSTWTALQNHIRKLADRINVWKGIPLAYSDARLITERLLDIDGKPADKVSKQAENKRDAILAAFSMPQYGTRGATGEDWINGVTFTLSSPNAPSVQRSKVSGLARMLRNVDPNGVGFALEHKARMVLAEFAGVDA